MVDNLIPLVNILDEKKGALKEAHLILFEKCNLRCSFCHQDHDSTVGMEAEEILTKVQLFLDTTDPKVPYVVNLTGGELFMDDIPDWMFGYYLAAGQMILRHFDNIKLVYGTNLIFADPWRVRRLITMLRSERKGTVVLATSYDPAGRFNPRQRQQFFENLEHVGDLCDTVNVVITKQNIEVFLAGTEGEEFGWLCDNFTVYFDHYIPSTLFEYHQPDEDLISQLYLNLNERYPNSYPIKEWKQNQFNETTCRSTKIINKDGVVTTCWSEAGKNAILDEGEGLKAKAQAEVAFMEKYRCLECEYYTRCGMRCFLHHSFVQDSLSDECKIKEMFDRILP